MSNELCYMMIKYNKKGATLVAPQTADKVLAVFNFIQICNIIKNILIYYIEVL